MLGNDVAIEPLDNNFLFFHGMHDAVVAFHHLDVLAYAAVAVEVAWSLQKQRAPCAKVAPTKVGRTNEDFFSLFHDGIVDRDILTLRIFLIDHSLLLVGTHDIEHAFEDFAESWFVYAECVDDGFYIPHKDTCIPEIVVLLNIFLCCLKIWFLAESVYTEYLLVAWRTCGEVCLYIAVACFWAICLHTKSYDGICFASKLQALCDYTTELLRIGNDMVAWCNHNVCLRVALLNSPTHIGYTWRSIATARLKKDVGNRNLRQLLMNDIGISAICNYCLGFCSVLIGQNRLPTPPAIITR